MNGKKEAIDGIPEFPEDNIIKKRSKKRISFSLIALIAILIISITAFWITRPKNCGYDKVCFIEQANACNKAELKQDFGGSILMYVVNDCVLKKEFEEFSEQEPEEIKDMFKGKDMECPYEQGNFDSELIQGLIPKIEECQGPLKNTVYELRIAQLLIE